MQPSHRGEVVGGEEQRHIILLLHADTVLAADHAALLDAYVHHAGGRLQRPLVLAAVAPVEQNDRVQVAVACVKHIGDGQPVLLGDPADLLHRVGQARARHHRVHKIVRRGEAAHGAEGVLAGGPHLVLLGEGAGGAYVDRAVAQADRGDVGEQLVEAVLDAIALDQQGGTGAGGQAKLVHIVHRLDREPVHDLQGRGQEAARDHLRDRAGGASDVGEEREHHAHRLGQPGEPEPCGGDQAERALAAGHDACEIVAGLGRAALASPDDCAIGQHELHAEHMAGGDAVLEAVGAA